MSDSTNKTDNNLPTARIRRGNLTLSIWENPGQYGPMYAMHIQRSYLDDGGNWQHTTSIREQDALPAAKLYDQADTWIQNRKREYRIKQAEQRAAQENAVPAEQPSGNGNGHSNNGNGTHPAVTVTLPDGNTVQVDPDTAQAIRDGLAA